MCFNKDISIISLFLGTLSSIMLVKYGEKQYAVSNNILGYFFFFTTLMQLIDYLIWIDLECTQGYNKLASYLGPILNHLQPTILFLLCYIFSPIKSGPLNNFAIAANLAYVLYTVIKYVSFIKNDNLCSSLTNNHVSWAWKHDFNYVYYHIMMIVNTVIYLRNTTGLIALIMGYVFFIMSVKYFKTNVGELWCFFSIYIPLIILSGEKIVANK